MLQGTLSEDVPRRACKGLQAWLAGWHCVSACTNPCLCSSPLRAQIWQYVAGDRPSLTRQEFFSAMKLVSLAQVCEWVGVKAGGWAGECMGE